jgi:hypothetical protein
MFQTKVVEKPGIHILCSVTFAPPPENRAVYEIMWKNIVDQGRPQMTIWRMRIACWIPKGTNAHSEYVILIAFPQQQWLHACWIPKSTNTHSEYVILIAFPQQQWLHERASMLHVHCLSC